MELKKIDEYKSGDVVECKVYNPRTDSHEFREGVVTRLSTIFNRRKDYPIVFVRTVSTYFTGTDDIITNKGYFYDKPNTIGYIYREDLRPKK